MGYSKQVNHARDEVHVRSDLRTPKMRCRYGTGSIPVRLRGCSVVPSNFICVPCLADMTRGSDPILKGVTEASGTALDQRTSRMSRTCQPGMVFLDHGVQHKSKELDLQCIMVPRYWQTTPIGQMEVGMCETTNNTIRNTDHEVTTRSSPHPT